MTHGTAAESRLARLRLPTYARFFRRAAGPEGLLFLCDADGSTVWCSDGAEGERTARELAPLAGAALPAGEGRAQVRRHPVDGGRCLLLRPLAPAHSLRIGCLAAVVHDRPGAGEEEASHPLAEALEDIANCLQDEYTLQGELDQISEELTDRYEELNLVYGMADSMRRSDQAEGFCQHLLETCTRHLPIDAAVLVLPDGGPPSLALGADAAIANLDLVLLELRGNLFHYVAAGRETLVLNDRQDPRRAYLLPNLPYKILAAPVRADQALTAVLVVLNRETRRDFSNSDRALIELVAEQAGTVMHAHRMLGEMRRFSGQMASALIAAVEAKDSYTRGHSERVRALSAGLGRALELREEELEQLHWGALLHDVGKIGIPDAILGKPGQLTADEFTFVKMHPERSYEILRHIDYLGDGLLAAHHHQERFDGSGYPRGLKGKSIPLLARIVAVADTFDAMTSSRAYRASCTDEEALDEIRRVAGTQLDPEIVEVFLRLCRERPDGLAPATGGGRPLDG